MKGKKSSIILPSLLLIGALLAAFAIGFAVIAAVAWATGWFLRLFLPLSLFEGMLLGLLFTGATTAVLFRLIAAFVQDEWIAGTFGQAPAGELEHRFHKIPAARFYNSPEERTWEAWLRYEMANDIYVELEDETRTSLSLNDAQMQELAIRLSEFGVGALKRKIPSSPDLSISVAALKREMKRVGQQPYDAEIMNLAVDGIDTTISLYVVEISELLEDRAWQSPARVPDHA